MRRIISIVLFLAAPLLFIGTASVSSAAVSSPTLPTVTGGFGATPTITFPSGPIPSTLVTKVLSKGNGSVVKKGNLLVANYVGQIWQGKIFDSSFSRKQVAAFPIGVGAVIKGWDEALVGQKIGTRLLLVVPPSLGYGSSGNSQAGITGKDTLAFVVDVVASFGKSIGTREGATNVSPSTPGIAISNIESSSPKITVAKTTKKPTKLVTTVLARGSGVKTTPGMVILQFLVNNWTNKFVTSTWKTGTPDGEFIGSKATPSVFDSLVGDRVGSRVLLELPANSSGGPYAVEVQIAAEVSSAASKPLHS